MKPKYEFVTSGLVKPEYDVSLRGEPLASKHWYSVEKEHSHLVGRGLLDGLVFRRVVKKKYKIIL